MSDLENLLGDLLHEAAPRPVDPAGLVDGARRYAARARRVRIAAVVVAILLGVGGAVGIGAIRDRATVPARLVNTPPPPTLAGHSWERTAKVTNGKGDTFTLVVRATVTQPATRPSSTAEAGKVAVVGPSMSGAYTLTNTTSTDYDLSAEVVVFAYWTVPAGFCTRYNQYLAQAGLPIPRVGAGQELCPMAMGDSTLPGLPQTLAPGKALGLPLVPGFVGLNSGPFQLTPADAAIAVTVTSQAPTAWAAFNGDLSTRSDQIIVSDNLPTS